MATKKDITDKSLIPVVNMGIGEVGYTIHNGTTMIRRNWAMPNVVLEVEFKELRMAINEPGVRQLFEVFNKELKRYEDGELIIKNEVVREKLNLKPLGEYTLDKDQIIDLFNNGSLEKFEDVLENCPSSILDKIVQLAVETPLDNLNKLNLIKAYSGKDVFTAIQVKKEQNKPSEGKRKAETTNAENNESGTRRKKV